MQHSDDIQRKKENEPGDHIKIIGLKFNSFEIYVIFTQITLIRSLSREFSVMTAKLLVRPYPEL